MATPPPSRCRTSPSTAYDSGKWKSGRTIPHYSQLKYKTNPRGTATATVGDYRWSFDYDTRGNLIATTDPSGAKKTLVIAANGTVSSETDARGGTTTYTGYDANGFPTAVTDPLARKTQFGYDSDGQLLWIQDAKHAAFTGGEPVTTGPTSTTTPSTGWDGRARRSPPTPNAAC